MNCRLTSLLLLLLLSWPQRVSAAGQDESPAAGTATPAEVRMQSWKHHVHLEDTSPYRHLEWRALGPTRQGGRIEAIACSPGQPPAIYVGAGSGNLWKSVNNGITWKPIFEKESTFTIGDVAVAPSDPNVIWVGSGETQPRHSGFSYAGTGVFKSTDGGATWSNMGLAETHHIGKVLIHPKNPDIVYVAAIGHAWTDNPQRGLFKTADGGNTWEPVLSIGDQTGVVDLVMDPEDPEVLYAAAWHKTRYKMAGPRSGIYKTTDGGTKWRRLENGLPRNVELGRSGLAVAASQPNVVYAFIDNHAPGEKDGQIVGAEVYRSDDKGQTWKRTHDESLYHVYTEYGWKFADVRVAPHDENEIFILGNRAYHSKDGGKTFQRISEKIVRLHDHKATGMHLDHHDLWIDPDNPDRLLLGNDGGLYMSYDRGATWLHVNNLPIGEFYTIHVDMDMPYNIYGGTQDNASHVGPRTAKLEDTKQDDWKQVFLDRWGGGDGFVTLPDPTDPEWIYYEHQHGDMYRKRLGGSILTGADGDRRIRPDRGRKEPRYRFGWHTPLVISHHDPFALYAGGNKLLRSANRGEDWTEVSPEFAADPGRGNRANAPLGVITSISQSRLKPGLIYVGLDNGQVHVTRDDGRSWTACNQGLPEKWVSRVEASRHELGTVYVSMTGFREDDFATYLYRSTDYGETWASIAANLPAESVNVIREDPRTAEVLYVGTDLGVYVSTDRGASWQSLCASLPTTPVHDLAVHSREHELVIATHGRSVFLLDVKEIVDSPRTEPAGARSGERLTAELVGDVRLRSLGPALKPGRIADIVVDPRSRSVWYLATASSGLWKTTTRGITWTPIFDQGGSYSLGCVTLDPNNADVVWLGTGENSSNRSVGYGDGIYKSNDGGQTWKQMGLRDSQHIAKILVDPRNSDVVLVASQGPLWSPGGDRGLFKTTDGGRTWKAVLEVSENTGITDAVFDPRDPDVIYAAAYQRRRHVGVLIGGGPESAIYKSDDGGRNWKKLTVGLPNVDTGRIALAVSPQNPDVVYALITAAGDESGFFRSADRGATWTRQSNYDAVDPQYYGEIYADPHQFDRVYAMDVRVQVTEDGGKSFRATSWEMHVDNHALAFDPTDVNHMLVGNDGGLYETHDRGRTWRHFTNLPIAQFYRVTADNALPFYNVYGGTQDNGSMGGPSRTLNSVGIRTSDWIRTGGADGFQPRVDPEDPNIVYSTSQNGGINRLDKRTGVSVGIRPPREENAPAVRWHWDSPFIVSPHSPARLYLAGSRLYRSDDRGDNWRPVSPDLTRQLDRDKIPAMGRIWGEDAVQKHRFTTALSVSSALAESPLQEGLLYVGTDDGLVQISEDGGENWRKIDKFPGVPQWTCVSDVCASRHDANTLYVAFNNYQQGDFKPYLLKSTDRGKTWTSIAGNLPGRHVVWSIVEDHVSGDHVSGDLLFAGTEFGLFFTPDGGRQWVRLKGGAPTVAFRDLQLQRREHDLVAATFGRGLFVLDDYTALRYLTGETLAREGWLFPPRNVRVYDELRYVVAAHGNYTTQNPPFGAMLTYYLRDGIAEGEGSRVVLTIADSDGNPVRQIVGPTAAGLHRVTWDLRRGPARSEGSSEGGRRGRRGGRRSGPLVRPGQYRIILTKTVDGEETTLAEPQTIEVVPLLREATPDNLRQQ